MRDKKPMGKDHLRFLLLAVFGVAINQICFLYGLKFTTPIHSAIIMTTNPIVVTIIALFVLREKISLNMTGGIILGVCGALVLILYSHTLGKEGLNTPLGDLLTLINSISWAVFIVLAKKTMREFHTITVMKWIFLYGLPLVFFFGWDELRNTHFAAFTGSAWFATIFVIVATTFLAYLLNTFALKALSSSTVSAYIYLQPFLAAFFAVVFGKDQITGVKILAGCLILAGVYLSGRKGKGI